MSLRTFTFSSINWKTVLALSVTYRFFQKGSSIDSTLLYNYARETSVGKVYKYFILGVSYTESMLQEAPMSGTADINMITTCIIIIVVVSDSSRQGALVSPPLCSLTYK